MYSLNTYWSHLRNAKDFKAIEKNIRGFSKYSSQEIINFLDSRLDSTAEIISNHIGNLNSFHLLDKLQEHWKTDPSNWGVFPVLLKKTLRIFVQKSSKKTKKVFEHYENNLLDSLANDQMGQTRRIIEIFLNLKSHAILTDNYVKEKELELLEKISHWAASSVSQTTEIEFLKWVFSLQCYKNVDFDSEIKNLFPYIAKSRLKLLQGYEELKQTISSNQFNFTSVEIVAFLHKKNETDTQWFPFHVKVTFSQKQPKQWESLLETQPRTFCLHYAIVTLDGFQDWIEDLINHYKIKVNDNEIELNPQIVSFVDKGYLNSRNDYLIGINSPRDYVLFTLANISPINNPKRLRIQNKAFQNFKEIIEEELKYNLKGLKKIREGSLFLTLPRFHWHFNEILQTGNKWTVSLFPSHEYNISEYKLFYILKNKQEKTLKKGWIQGTELTENNDIIVPLGADKIICFLDYDKETVDELELTKKEIKPDYFRIPISGLNNGLKDPNQLDPDELTKFQDFICKNILISDIEEAVIIWASPFIPGQVDKRMLCLHTLGLKYETFQKEIHKHTTQKIHVQLKALKDKSLGSILAQNWNILRGESWFNPYMKNDMLDPKSMFRVKGLIKANDEIGFQSNWNDIIENKYGIGLNLQRLLITILCRNIEAHLAWISLAWTTYTRFDQTVRLILETYIITWKIYCKLGYA